MAWNRRTMMVSSSAGVAILAALAALALLRTNVPSAPAPIRVAYAPRPTWGDAVLASGGQRLTRLQLGSGWLIDPPLVPRRVRQTLRGQGIRIRKGAMLLLSAGSRGLTSGPGVAKAKTLAWEAVVPSEHGILGLIIEASKRESRGPWHNVRGHWQLGSAPPIHTTLSAGLSESIASAVGSGGAVLVVNRRGQVLAADQQGQNWWAAYPVGASALPALLAAALSHASVLSRVGASGATLTTVWNAWGASGLQQALEHLGFGTVRLGSMGVSTHDIPTTVTLGTLTGGQGLSSGSLQLARAYLPFIDGGHEPTLSVLPGGASSSGSSILTQASVSTVLSGLPAIKEQGRTMRVWRPAGHWSIIIDPSQHQLAILEGPATASTLSVAEDLASHGE